MDDRFGNIHADRKLSAKQLDELTDNGYVVVPGPVSPDGLSRLTGAYDSVVDTAPSAEVKIGSTTTRINNFVNRSPEFDAIYIHQTLLEAAWHVIGRPFKLSSMHGRTLRAGSAAPGLHVDFKRDERRFPLLSFIVMVDEFRPENGATRFVPGSHKWREVPVELTDVRLADYEGRIRTACGPAGSMIIFNGSVWHGHGTNKTVLPRRSIQGAFIPFDEQAATDFSSCLWPETLARISPLAKSLLAI
ncbi:MAG TPA: phytanoyl-CoA dioxygenase family protein [Pyrinomonadaceae bacterium]|jgi:ectoine hydroxylase-related dioxygenase (phytanoyl-CoA dioxygenase family)|nr:phytanoyl-CoA dioxygenase family protein [Pyrinomonadaceae bacterium]